MLNLKSSHKECLGENAVKLHKSMPAFFISKINKLCLPTVISAPFVVTAKTLSK